MAVSFLTASLCGKHFYKLCFCLNCTFNVDEVF